MENEEVEKIDKKQRRKAKREFNKGEFWTKIMAGALALIMVVAVFATLIFALI